MTAVTFRVLNRVAYITLNRPEVLNAINSELRAGLREALARVDADREIRAAVITGAGERAFCTGADLREMSRDGLAGHLLHGGDSIGHVRKPLVAAIRGYCIAAGLELALQCDIRIAAEDAQFGLPEARRGLPGGYGLHHLSRLIPPGEAMYMQLTGDTIGAHRAYDIGLVQSVVPVAQLAAAATAMAEKIATNSPRAVQAIKHVVGRFRDLPVDEAMRRAAPIEREVFESGDYKEGAAAFVEKRRPVWAEDATE